MNNNNLIKFILTISALVLGLCSVFAFRTYPADQTALEQIYANKSIAINETLDYYLITPINNNNDNPTIVFYSGGLVTTQSYLYNMGLIAGKLNSKVVLIKPPLNLALIPSVSIEAIKSRLNLKSIILSGHSLGGVKACMEYKPNLDIKKLVLMGSYCTNDLSKADLEYVSLYGANDKVLQLKNLEDARKNTPPKSTFKTIEGANHAIFGSYGQQAGDGKAEITKTEFLDIISKFF
jgi:hypothetical protein